MIFLLKNIEDVFDVKVYSHKNDSSSSASKTTDSNCESKTTEGNCYNIKPISLEKRRNQSTRKILWKISLCSLACYYFYTYSKVVWKMCHIKN